MIMKKNISLLTNNNTAKQNIICGKTKSCLQQAICTSYMFGPKSTIIRFYIKNVKRKQMGFITKINQQSTIKHNYVFYTNIMG